MKNVRGLRYTCQAKSLIDPHRELKNSLIINTDFTLGAFLD